MWDIREENPFSLKVAHEMINRNLQILCSGGKF
jgi:hypothetical protein